MDAYTALNQSRLFRDLDRRASRALAESSRWINLRGGGWLYRAGDAGDAVYILVNGRLRVTRPDPESADALAGEVALGESIGEVSVITGETRSDDVLAMRDSSLLRIAREDFEQVARRFPDAMLRVTRLILQRLRRASRAEARDSARNTRTYACLPGHAGIDVRDFSRRFSHELSAGGPVLRLDTQRIERALGDKMASTPFDDSESNRKLALWLNQLEDCYRFLVYQASGTLGPWTSRCLRQADRILVLVHADQSQTASPGLDWFRQQGFNAPVEIVLIDADDQPPRTPLAWREAYAAVGHHIVRTHSSRRDMGRLARLLSGRGLCLVLGGGGARGFAHLGLLRALAERGIPVDAVGGTSMGSFVAALVASGMDYETMLATLRATFVENNYLNDYSLSRLSLISGRKFRAQLEALFGDLRIEDMDLPFYCVSTSLTHGRAVIHDRGRVADWVGTSMAVPGIAPPTVYRGELLVDGGLMHGVDFDTMMAQGRGRVIFSNVSRANDLSFDGMAHEAPDSLLNMEYKDARLTIFKILFHSATLLNEQKKAEVDKRADLVLHMPVGDIGMFDWDELDNIAYRAYHYAHEVLDGYVEKHPDLKMLASVPTTSEASA